MKFRKLLGGVFSALLCVITGIWIYGGITVSPLNLFTLLAILLIAILLFLTDNTLKFLTIPRNFLTRLVMGTLLVALGFYASQYIATGVGATATTIGSIDAGFLVIRSIELSDTLSLIFGCLIISALYDVLNELISCK